jgi:hypothetical protein
MPTAKKDRIDTLIQEVRELKSEIKELRMLLMYEFLNTQDQRSRGSDTLLVLTKQALKAAVEQLADLERNTNTQARDAPQAVKVPLKSRNDAPKPMVDVNREIAILKKEMATSLRNAAKEIEEEGAQEDTEETE